MKKLVSILALCVVTAPAVAAASYIRRDGAGGYNVTYDYLDKAKRSWYLTGRLELSFLNWKNKYSAPDWAIADPDAASDKYSFEPVFGGSLAIGRRFDYFWRTDLEAGYLGNFSDKDGVSEFQLSIPYLSANLYYDFSNGVYVGGGLGATLVYTKLDDATFVDYGNSSHRSVGAMGALMLGYAKKLDENLVFDVRYRLAGLTGSKQSRVANVGSGDFTVENKINFIMDNSLSVGIRYEF